MATHRFLLPILLLTSQCAGPAPADPGVTREVDVPPVLARAVPSSSTPSAAPPTASAVTTQAIPRVSAPGDTRGTIACGAASCVAGKEVCTTDAAGAWACVAEKTFGEGLACDDGLDCPRGETCCSRFIESFGSSTCVARAQVEKECRSELCVEGGAQCPRGTACVEISKGQGGTCEPPKGPATCGGEKRCPTSAPICALTNAGAICVAPGSREYASTPGELRYECTRQSDCNGGDACSIAFGEAAPSVAAFCAKYGPHLANRVCDPRKKGKTPCSAEGHPKELPWFGTEPLGGP